MCFSATASFTASIILAAIGISLLIKVKKSQYMLLAMIPLFFGLQQASEGFVWINLPDESISKYIFLFFAYMFWPIWVPIAVWYAENNATKKQILSFFIALGIITGCLQALMIPDTHPIFYKSSIHYKNTLTFTTFRPLINSFYALCCIAPFFISSLRKIWIIGLLSAVAGSLVLWIDHLLTVSMWCFFAALISCLFWSILPKKNG